MGLFNRTDELDNRQKDIHQEIADGILAYGEEIANNIVRQYRCIKEMMWNHPGFTIEDIQLVVDKMGIDAISAFTKLGALGQFINSQYSNKLNDSELVSPLRYVISNGRIIFDKNQTYPGSQNN